MGSTGRPAIRNAAASRAVTAALKAIAAVEAAGRSAHEAARPAESRVETASASHGRERHELACSGGSSARSALHALGAGRPQPLNAAHECHRLPTQRCFAASSVTPISQLRRPSLCGELDAFG